MARTPLPTGPNTLTTETQGRALLKSCEMLGEAQVVAVGEEPVPGPHKDLAYHYGAFGRDGKLYFFPRAARRVAYDARLERRRTD